MNKFTLTSLSGASSHNRIGCFIFIKLTCRIFTHLLCDPLHVLIGRGLIPLNDISFSISLMKLTQAYQRHPMVSAKRPPSDAPTVVLMGGGPRCQSCCHVVVACSCCCVQSSACCCCAVVVACHRRPSLVASLPGFVIVVLCRRHLLVVVGQVRWVGTEVLTNG